MRTKTATSLWILIGIALLSFGEATPADTPAVHKFLDGRVSVEIPPGYVLLEGPEDDSGTVFVRRGDWADALAKALPGKDFDGSFLEDWFEDDIRDYVRIDIVELEDHADVEATPRDIHERFARGFVERWGEFTFSLFDDETGIGRCGNYIGAFVFVSTRKVGRALVIVESLDNVEALAAEEGSFPDTEPLSDGDLWEYFRLAANDAAVDRILNSARLLE